MQVNWLVIVTTLLLVALVGCQKGATPVAAAQAESEAYASPNLGAGYEDAISTIDRLVLGTFRLEGTPDAVTPEQAQTLLPLWQLIQGGTLQGIDETNAVLKQIESTMSSTQLVAIEGMQLTNEDLRAWMEEQGIAFPAGGPTEGQGGPGAFQNLSEEERTQMREEFQNMSPEARATRLAEMGAQQPGGRRGQPGGQEGQGFDPNALATRGAPGGAPGGGPRGSSSFLIQLLIGLLTVRAAQ